MRNRHPKVGLPNLTNKVRKNRKVGPQKRSPTPTRLFAVSNPNAMGPTLLFRRRYPKTQWVVPPIQVPLYWFDLKMLRKKLMFAIPPDVLVVDGRRFRVLAQDHKVIGLGYTRWLVYEEAAVPKGEKP